MSRRLAHTAAMAILIPIVGACAGGSANIGPGAQSYQQELRRVAEETITEASVLANISVIAHDSMGGRDTPSPGLEMTAEYFASKYREWGVEPIGENGTYFQRYPLVKKGADQEASFIEVTDDNGISRFEMGDWGFVGRGSTNDLVGAEAVVLAGPLTPELIQGAGLVGKIAVVLYDSEKAADWNRWMREIRSAGPAAVIQFRNDKADSFNRFRPNPDRMRFSLDMGGTSAPEFYLHDNILASNPATSSWPNFDDMRSSPTPTVMEVPANISFSFYAPEKVFEQTTAPNVAGVIRGSDPVLRDEYVVYSAHMDHVGTNSRTRTPGDTIWNGADDDASGSTGILLVAEAYSKLKVKPRRSIIILHVSGEEKGLLGSEWYAEHPTVDASQIVANVNYDMIGRNNPDSIVVIGKEHSDMGTTLARVNANHQELNLVTADDIWPDQRFYFRSDHYNFARKGVPILFFFNGVHEDYHRETDHVDKIDTSKLSRVAKIGFYLGAEIANTTQRPQWVPESYTKIVEGAGGR